MRAEGRTRAGDRVQFAVVHVDELLCGIDIRSVREINRNLDITRVWRSPAYVRGVINLRGQITTVIDLRMKFGLPARPISPQMRIVVVRAAGEDTGLLVDRADDVVTSLPERVEAPPPHMHGELGRYLSGVCKQDGQLLALLDVEELLKV